MLIVPEGQRFLEKLCILNTSAAPRCIFGLLPRWIWHILANALVLCTSDRVFSSSAEKVKRSNAACVIRLRFQYILYIQSQQEPTGAICISGSSVSS